MHELEMLIVSNRCMLCFSVLVTTLSIYYGKTSDLPVRMAFCFSRRKNMAYAGKKGALCAGVFFVLGIALYEMVSFLFGYPHITLSLAAFLLLGFSNFVLSWSTGGMSLVAFMILGGLLCNPVNVIAVVAVCRVGFDRYLGYAAFGLFLLFLLQYRKFLDGWRKGDL